MKYFNVCFALLGIALFAGCGSDSDSGDGGVELSWAIGGSTCGTVGVSLVEITVYDGERIYSSDMVACQLGGILVANLPVGTYQVRIDGIQAASAFPVYEGSADKIRVSADEVTVVPRIYLVEKPGGIDLSWRFGTGSLCTFAGVDTIDVSVWDIHSNRIYRESLPCDPLMALVEAEENEPTRALYQSAMGVPILGLYAGSYTVQALGMLAEQGEPIYWAEEGQVIVQHAKLTAVDLVLNSCEDQEICL